MGLPKADEVLREAMAMGADKGVLVTDRCLGGADTWATAQTIAGAIRNMDYDLIITGRQAIDGDTAQVGPQISEDLDLPLISYAQKIVDVDEKNRTITSNVSSMTATWYVKRISSLCSYRTGDLDTFPAT
jgi:electron transfer flavoprotein beta subunit